MDDKNGPLNDKQKRYVEKSYQAGKRMVSLVNALLNVSRLELGTFAIEPEPTDLINLIQICLDELKPEILPKKLKIKTAFPKNLPLINADPKLTAIIVQNLLSNAVRYTPASGKIVVSLDNNNDQLLFSVSDSGLGIPKHQHSKVFTKLFRGDNIQQLEPDGSGLGLYIVKEIVNKAGGNIWFQSQENQGSTFYFSLPLTGMVKKTGTRQLVYQVV